MKRENKKERTENAVNFEANMSHGGLLTPFAKYHTEIGEVLPFYPIHWHKEMEIVKILAGVGSFCVNGDWYNASAGDIIFISPYENHSIKRYGNETMSIDAIVFDIEMLAAAVPDMCTIKYFTPLMSGEKAVPVIMRPSNHMYRSFDQSLTSVMFSVSGQEYGYELSLKANLMWLFYHIYHYDFIVTKKRENEERSHRVIRKVLEYIRQHFAAAFTLSDLAAECGYSDTYLMKLFKKYTGMTCVDYINNYRLTKAGEQLMSPDQQIIDVAISCGFSNISYFNKLFKETYGMTPKEFRREYGCG